VPWSTEIELAAAEPNGRAVNGLRYTLGLVALLSSALRKARWSSIRCRSSSANECRSRTKARAWVPFRFWQPAGRFTPESLSCSALGRQMYTPPTLFTTLTRPPNPMPM